MDDPLPLLTGLGAIALLAAAVAWFADRRRARRSDPDAVGFMPWTGVFFWAVLVALLTLGLDLKAWLAG